MYAFQKMCFASEIWGEKNKLKMNVYYSEGDTLAV